MSNRSKGVFGIAICSKCNKIISGEWTYFQLVRRSKRGVGPGSRGTIVLKTYCVSCKRELKL